MTIDPIDEAAGSVRLSLPASPRYLAAARVVATSLGVESGLSVDDLEDLRLGVNELVSVLIEYGGDRVELEFANDPRSVTVGGRLVGGAAGSLELDELTSRILKAVADDYEIDGVSFSLTKASSLR